ncbi:MAG: helicase-related protein, partial [candidate division Zixibacteria bacterium]
KYIDEIPPSIQNERLGRCLHSGIAFHHAELDRDQRALVEDGFRAGEIRALVSTTTLAWGVNLPAKNVFIEMMKYDGRKSSNSRPMLLPISVTDFHQAAGRAGRLGSGDDFGRAVMMASTPYEHEILWDRYVYSQNELSESRPEARRFLDLLFRLIVCGAVNSETRAISIVSEMYCFRNPENHDIIRDLVSSSTEYLEKEGLLVVEKSGYFRVTLFGESSCSTGLSVKSCVRIGEAIRDSEFCDPQEALFFALESEEWTEQGGYYSRINISAEELFRKLGYHTDGLIERSEYLNANLRRVKSKRVAMKFTAWLFALEWISGAPTRDLEKLFIRGSGGLKHDADTLSWILNGIEKIVRCLKSGWPPDKIDELSTLSLQLKYGVATPMIPLAKKLEIDREFIRRLYDFGIKTENDLYQVDCQTFQGILPRSVIAGIVEKIGQKSSEKSSPGNKSVSDYILFTGVTEKRLKQIIVFGRSIFLQPKLYSYLQKLWWAYKSGKQWVYKDSLEPGFNQSKYIFKLKRSLGKYSGEIEIVSDGAGSYRLILSESEDAADIVSDNQQIGVNGR